MGGGGLCTCLSVTHRLHRPDFMHISSAACKTHSGTPAKNRSPFNQPAGRFQKGRNLLKKSGQRIRFLTCRGLICAMPFASEYSWRGGGGGGGGKSALDKNTPMPECNPQSDKTLLWGLDGLMHACSVASFREGDKQLSFMLMHN